MKGNFESNVRNISETKLIKVPTLISAFQCGFGTPFNDGYTYEEIPADAVKNVKRPYVIIAEGDSMAPTIHSGDKIILEYTDHAEHNDIIAAHYNGKFLIKVFFRNGFSFYLKSINKYYPPIKINEEDEFQVLGKAKYVLSTVNNSNLSRYLYE